MELTGKCKKDFKEWFTSNKEYSKYEISNPFQEDVDIGIFFPDMPDSMQWGVLVDFFDSKKFDIVTRKEGIKYLWYVGSSVSNVYINTKESLQEARETAINKANEIYNNA